MNLAQKNKLFVGLALGFYFIFFNLPGFAGDSGAVQPKEHSGLERPETGCKKKYRYQYYPTCSVYYDIQRELYFYREDDNWKIFAKLPRNLVRQVGDYVNIETDSDKPYLDNDKHVKKFPPVTSRKPKKNMWSKLIFVLLYEHAPE